MQLSWTELTASSFTKVINDGVNWGMHRSLCSRRPHLTYEVTEYTFQFLYSVLPSPFRWVVEYFKTWRLYEVQPLFTRKLKFLLGTLPLQRTSHNEVSLFSHRSPHRVFSSLWVSSSHRKHHQPKHPDRRSHTDGFLLEQMLLPRSFLGNAEKISVSKLRRNPTSGESGKPIDWTEVI